MNFLRLPGADDEAGRRASGVSDEFDESKPRAGQRNGCTTTRYSYWGFELGNSRGADTRYSALSPI
jgi:hypothetical protein